MRKLFFILAAFMPVLCFSQSFGDLLLKSPTVGLVEKAVQNGFYIVCQPYQLEDTVSGQRFGRYGEETFGKKYTLGIKVGDYVVFDNKISTPWENDENFERYRHTHRPVRSNMSVTEIPSNRQTSLCVDSVIAFNGSYSQVVDTSTMKGFHTAAYSAPAEGWFVWVNSEKPIDEYNPESKVDFSVMKKTVQFDGTTKPIDIDTPQGMNNIWGGVFVVPEQTEVGQLTFNVAGTFRPTSDGSNWTLVPLVREETATTVVASPEPVGDELTPLIPQDKNQGKKKK